MPRPKSTWAALILIILLAGAGILTGCSGGTSDPFQLELECRDQTGTAATTFAAADTITLALSIRNTADGIKILSLPDSQIYDFELYTEPAEELVWRWSEGQSFDPGLTTIAFTWNEKIFYAEDWDQTDKDAVLLPRGQYTIKAFIGSSLDPLQETTSIGLELTD